MKDLLILDNAPYTVTLPLVSVIVPCYNHAAYVEQALNSIIADTYSNKEIVIIDDGSKDNSKMIIEQWISHHKTEIAVNFTSRENRGLCATLNELVKNSKGKYLVCLASDDALFNNTIAERVERLETLEPHGKLVLVSDAMVVDEDDNVVSDSSMTAYNKGIKNRYMIEEGILYETILNPSISGATVIMNRKIFEKIGPYPEDLRAEDWYFYQRAASIYSIAFYDKIVSLYRVHSGSSSGAKASLNTQLMLAKAMTLTFWRNLSFYPTIKFKILGVKQFFRYAWLLTKIRLKLIIHDK